jgi:hypothetical protein
MPREAKRERAGVSRFDRGPNDPLLPPWFVAGASERIAFDRWTIKGAEHEAAQAPRANESSPLSRL